MSLLERLTGQAIRVPTVKRVSAYYWRIDPAKTRAGGEGIHVLDGDTSTVRTQRSP
jgi:hypothetical protein